MFFLTSIVVAGAVAFCAGEPPEPRCTDASVVEASLSDANRAILDELADAAHLSRSTFAGDAGERWRIRGPRQRGDCEDRLLWAAQELRRHPELARSYRFVAVTDPIEGGRSNGRRVLHLILAIEGDGGERIVIDTQHRNPRPWSAYAGREAYTPSAGLGGRWTAYR